jgi:hypothetical protein
MRYMEKPNLWPYIGKLGFTVHRLRVFENRMLRIMFRLKREEETA